MQKYKLIKCYPGSPELGTIEEGSICNDLKNWKEYWQELKPLFYCEDFPDGSFPSDRCGNCYKLCENKPKLDCIHYIKSKGHPIYEGGECYTVHCNTKKQYFLNKKSVEDIMFFGHAYNNLKCFSNKKNAVTCFHEAKWKNNLKYGIGDYIIFEEAEEPTFLKITGIDFYNLAYTFEDELGVVYFNDENWITHNEFLKKKIESSNFKLGDNLWSTKTNCYLGEINEFWISHEELNLYGSTDQGEINLDKDEVTTREPKIVCKTEDGYNAKEGDILSWVNPEEKRIHHRGVIDKGWYKKYSNYKYFHNERIAEKYLDSLKPKLKEGNWYRIKKEKNNTVHTHNAIIRYSKDKRTYGFDFEGGWTNGFAGGEHPIWNDLDRISEVFDEEIKNILLDYAKENYPIGTKVGDAIYATSVSIQTIKGYHYVSNIDIDNNNISHLYSDGVWAEIIEKSLFECDGKFFYESDFVEGEIYWSNNDFYSEGHIWRYNRLINNRVIYSSGIIWQPEGITYSTENRLNDQQFYNFRKATKEEIEWLEACEKAGKFISKEKASKPILYTTSDGVDVRKGDLVYLVMIKFPAHTTGDIEVGCWNVNPYSPGKIKVFSTKEKAVEFKRALSDLILD